MMSRSNEPVDSASDSVIRGSAISDRATGEAMGLCGVSSNTSLTNASTLFGEPFQQFLFSMSERARRGRKDFEDPGKSSTVVDPAVVAVPFEDGNDEDGTNAKPVRSVRVNARIELGIDGNLGLMSFETSAGQTVASVERDTEIWRQLSGRRAADYFVPANKRKRCGVCVSGFGGTDYEVVKHEIESEVPRKSGAQVLLKGMNRVG